MVQFIYFLGMLFNLVFVFYIVDDEIDSDDMLPYALFAVVTVILSWIFWILYIKSEGLN